MSRDGYSESFVFGPIERQGIVGALRLSQAAVLIAGCGVAVVAVRSFPAGRGLVLGVLAMSTACVCAFARVRGRTVEQWAPVVASWVLLRTRGGRRYQSSLPEQGVVASLSGAGLQGGADLPESLAGCQILSVTVDGGHEVGVFRDPSLNALTAVLAVRVRAFGLLAEADQERRLSRWGRVLAGLARGDGLVRRVSVLERTVPSDGDEMQRYLVEARDRALPALDDAARSYDALLQAAGDVTQDHELFVALQVDERRAAGRVRRPGPGDAQAQARVVLVRELLSFA